MGISLPAQAQSGNPHPPTALALLEQHCVPCHGGEKTKAGFDLTTHAALLRGGESGPAVVLGRPELSLFQRMITHEEEPGMPHKKDKLPEAEIAIIAAWIRDGAIYTRELRQAEIAAGEPRRPEPPLPSPRRIGPTGRFNRWCDRSCPW